MFNIVPLILYQIELHCLSALFPDPSTLIRDLAEFFPIEVFNAEATCFFFLFFCCFFLCLNINMTSSRIIAEVLTEDLHKQEQRLNQGYNASRSK